MSIYKPFMVGLKRVAKLLSGKESKQQLLVTCFSSGFAVGFRQEVASFKCSVHEKRWNTIAFAVRSLSELEPALRSCWDVQVYLRGRNMPQAKEDLGGDEHGVHLEGANEALLSDHWWSCLHIFLQIAVVQSAATEYANGCDCHSELLREDVGSDLRQLWESCPLRGRRCPQLVAGEFFTVAQRLFDCSAVRLEADLPRNMSQQQVHELMSDFEAARQSILSTYIMKLSFWGEAPHALAGLGHQDANVRCKYLRKCLQSSSSHPRIQELKAHEAECLVFLEGGGQWDGSFPFLASLAAELRLMWCSAWRVEGQHARTKRGVTQAGNHTAAYVSLCHRLPELRNFLRCEPRGLVRLAEAFAKLTRRTVIARLLGISLPHAVSAGWLTGRQSSKTIALIYHDDPYTKYTLSLPAKVKLQGCVELSLPTEDTGAASVEAPIADHAVEVRRTHALEALKGLVKAKTYYSMPLSPSAFYKLRSLIAPTSSAPEVVSGHLAWEPAEQLALSWPTLAVDEAVSVRRHLEGAGEVLTKEAIFWSVVHSQPARFHRTRVGAEASLAGVWIL